MRVTSWQPGWADFPPALLEFWTERHLCSLTTLRADGRPHVIPVGVALDVEESCAWVITNGTSRKAHQAAATRGSAIEGTARVLTDEASVQRAVDRYAARYRTPKPNPLRVALRIEVDRFLVSGGLV